jgi:hypothetical protein
MGTDETLSFQPLRAYYRRCRRIADNLRWVAAADRRAGYDGERAVTLSDWTSLLCNKVIQETAWRVERRSVENGWLRVEFERYGLLVMDEDRTEVLLWLLDKDGRTNGPVWASTMTSETAVAAAAEVVRVIKAAPDVATFTARPPKGRDMAREDALNALWARVRQRIDQLQLTTRNEGDITAAIKAVERYINDLARSDEGNAIAEFAWPFQGRSG